MTYEERAASLTPAEIVDLLVSRDALTAAVNELRRELAWFQRQLFGEKSERRLVDPEGRQLFLGELGAGAPPVPLPPETVASYQRRARRRGSEEEEGPIRFDPSVPVEEIRVPIPEGVSPQTHEKISEKVTERLAQRPATYVVMRIVREVWKEKGGGTLVCSPVPAAVVERSVADVSVLAGLVVDKFLYHLPLYRQHQRMGAAGVHLSRATLTNWVHGTAELVTPIYEAQLTSILEGSVVTMDETPIKAGRAEPGKMKRGYFWPVYGDRDEVAFPFSPSRGGAVVREVLGEFGGVLVSDGYRVYEQHQEKMPGLTHAQCWSHARRKFVEAQGAAPALCGKALEWIGALYRVEESLRGLGLGEEKKLQYRAEHAKPVVDGWFEWLGATVEEEILLPSDPFLEAANYSLKRKDALRVFLVFRNGSHVMIPPGGTLSPWRGSWPTIPVPSFWMRPTGPPWNDSNGPLPDPPVSAGVRGSSC